VTDKARLPHDWYPAPLPETVSLGESSWLYSSFAFLHCRSSRPRAVTVGHSSGVYNGCFFELGPEAEVEIGDYSTLVGVIVATNGRVRIGNYCFLAHEVVLADSFAPTPIHAGDPIEGNEARIILEDDVWVGANVVLLAGAHIGQGAIIGAGTVVDFEVPAYAIVAGNPARVVGDARGAGAS
jgi:acetyltransferase-like isoleucine patch superfamily enzyme